LPSTKTLQNPKYLLVGSQNPKYLMDYLVGAAPIPSQRLLPYMSVPPRKTKLLPVIASSSSKTPNPILRTLRTTISSAILLTATSAALLSIRARAEPSNLPPSTVETIPLSETAEPKSENSSPCQIPNIEIIARSEIAEPKSETSDLSHMLELKEQPSDALREMIYTKLESASDDQETITLLRKVIACHPSEVEWKLIAAKLLSDNREFTEARKILEEVLSQEPLSLEALHEFTFLMHLAKEDSVVYEKLEEAIEIAKGENKVNEVREIKFIKAQMLVLQHKLEEALRNFEELRNEDGEDYRPYFALGMIFSLLDKDKEAQQVFQKLKEISGGNFEVDTLLQSCMSSMRLFRTEVAGK
jgi:tetratricopeptide (TPR) repeat protein